MKTLITLGLVGFSLLTLRADDQVPAEAPAENADATTNKLDMTEIVKSPVVFTNSVGMAMVPIPAGFWVGRFEVTQSEYQKVMGGNPSHSVGKKNPVDSVSWNNAMAFCEKLTLLERAKSHLSTNFLYILPTDSQWEMLVSDATLDDAITSIGHTGPWRTHPEAVGASKPNSYGLYDMRGNVMEFQLDRANPGQPYRVLRGGAYDTWFEVNLRIAFRNYAPTPDDAQPDYGFRVIMVMQAPPTPAK